MSSGRGCSQDGAVVGTIMFFHVKHDKGIFPIHAIQKRSVLEEQTSYAPGAIF